MRSPTELPPSGSKRSIETILLASTACLLAAVAWPVAIGGLGLGDDQDDAIASAPPSELIPGEAASPAGGGPVIQLALLLDTSSSMDGLIDQARTQLWSVVNTLDSATYHGDRPRLQIALYEYGNDGLSGEQGWIRRVSPFTSELDQVSQALFSLSTNGGQEHAGQVIGRSIDELDWRDGDGVLRVAYIAGNEGFDQGPVAYGTALAGAKHRGVVINTVYCGGPDDSDAAAWRDAAALAGGRFLTIDHNQVVQHIAAPQDAEIAELGSEINRTYIRYGADGRKGLDNLVEQDDNMAGYGVGSVVTRSVSKSSHMYRNDSWDLVDAVDAQKVDLAEIDQSTLPEALQGLDEAALREHVQATQAERTRLQGRLGELARERESFVAAERARLSSDDPESLDHAILDAIREQAAAAGFSLDQA